MPTPPPSSSDSEDTEVEYTPQTPFIVDLEYRNGREIEYEPIFRVQDMNPFGPSFEVPMGISPTAAAMTEIFLPDRVLDKWVECTNAYAEAMCPAGRRKQVSKPDILRFLAAIQYSS